MSEPSSLVTDCVTKLGGCLDSAEPLKAVLAALLNRLSPWKGHNVGLEHPLTATHVLGSLEIAVSVLLRLEFKASINPRASLKWGLPVSEGVARSEVMVNIDVDIVIY